MGIRTEKVVLTLDDRFSTKGARVAAQAALMASAMDRLGDNADRAGVSTKRLGRDVDTSTNAFRKAGADIDVFSGRLKVMAQSAAVLGPALIPLTGAAVPAVAGLAAGLGAAAGAASIAMLAFNGVGDSLEALNTYQLDPSAENLAALREEFDRLGPDGERFVRFLDSIGGDLAELQQVAREGMFPGMEQGITDLLTLLPQVSDIVSRISNEMGDLSASAGAALSSDADWGEFFNYLQTDAAPTLDAFARSAGNVAASFANLMVAFAPLSRDFTRDMLEGSQALREWTANGDNFQGFIDYVRSVGPQASEFLGALVDAIVALTTALAPWGSTVLPILTTVLELFTAIASSPIGGPLATAAIAMLAFNRAAAGFGAVMGRVTPAVSSARAGLGQMRADLGTVATSWATAGAATERESKRVQAAGGRIRTSMAAMGKGAGVIGAVGVAATGAASGIGLQNTAMLGLAGTMMGPWGAAAGAGIGLMLDFQAAQDQAAASADSFAATLDQQTGALTANSTAWALDALTGDQLAALEAAGVNIEEMTQAVLAGADAWDQYAASAGLDTPAADGILGRSFQDELGKAAIDLNKLSLEVDDGRKKFELTKPAVDAAAQAVQGYGETSAEAAAATQAQRNAARSTAEQFVGLGNSLDNAKVSLGGWLAEMEKAARDLERFGRNAATAARKGLDQGLIASLNEAGPAGARRMAQLANATDAEIARANGAWRRGQKAIQDYVNLTVPPKTITVRDQATDTLARVKAIMNSMTDKTVTFTTVYHQVNTQSKVERQLERASGGPVRGPGTGTSDDIPAWLSNGEFVIKAAAVDKYGEGFFERLNAMQYADGGSVRVDGSVGYARGGRAKGPWVRAEGFGKIRHTERGWKEVAKRMDRLGDRLDRTSARIEKSMKSHEKAIDRTTKTLETWNQRRDQIKSAVTGSLERNWLDGDAGGVWSSDTKSGTAAFAQQQWKQQAADAKRLTALIANMRKRGAGDAFIAEILNSSDPLAAAKMFNGQTPSAMLASQKLFLDASRATASAANSTSSIYADEQRRATAELAGLRKDLSTLGKQLDRNHKQAEQTRKKESAAAAASKGARDRR
ncbi:hypothetical protein [Nocardioides panzhihuensis]|uniref:Phage tail tape measure protein n=1 Tax=Nocardioides panzhihuensis TaxID=860243 RepID=A0A7Z0DNH4_9ACTN|nr:hypothetical protein [Nocardioides panzhihuensis]NYI78737.1 hypothetical protein [Nocardioides panzhihuensis]